MENSGVQEPDHLEKNLFSRTESQTGTWILLLSDYSRMLAVV